MTAATTGPFTRWPRLVLLALIMSSSFAVTACSTTGSTVSHDADLVFCMSSEHRQELIDAAVILDLARQGAAADHLMVAQRDITIEAWRYGYEPDFHRACAALAAAEQIPQAPTARVTTVIASTLAVLLPVVVGALLTWFTSAWRDETSRSRLQADALRCAARTFVRACHSYVREWADRTGGVHPQDQVVLESRDELAAQLRKVSVRYPRWILPNRLQDMLSTGTLGEQMTRAQYWSRMSDEERAHAGQGLRSELYKLDIAVERIIQALERPGRPRYAMRSQAQVLVEREAERTA